MMMDVLTSNWKLNSLFLFLILIITLVYVAVKDFNYWKKRNVPYIRPIPFVGNILPIIRQKISIGQFMDNLYDETKKLKRGFLGFWICEKPCIFINDLDLIKHILVKDFASFSDRVVTSKSKNDPLAISNIFGMKHPHWKNMRSRLSPLFTTGKIKQMYTYFQENAKNMDILLQKMISDSDSDILDVKNICSRYTADNILQSIIGIEGQCLIVDTNAVKTGIDDAPFRKIAYAMMEDSPGRNLEFVSYFLTPEIVSWFNYKFFGEAASEFLRKIFWETVDRRMKSSENGKRGDLLDKLISFKEEKFEIDGLKYDGDVLVAQFVVLFVAGIETSSTSMTLTLHHLAWRPDIQKRVREEISTMKSRHDGKLTYEALNEMIYLDMVYKEILRLYPTLPFLDRLCIKDYKLPDESLIIEKGTKIYMSLSSVQRDPDYWINPNIFDPERFSAQNKNKIIPYSYMPFGEGPRICIGERIGLYQSKLGLATILSSYFIEKVENTKEYPDFSTMSVVTTPSPLIKLKFTYNPIK